MRMPCRSSLSHADVMWYYRYLHPIPPNINPRGRLTAVHIHRSNTIYYGPRKNAGSGCIRDSDLWNVYSYSCCRPPVLIWFVRTFVITVTELSLQSWTVCRVVDNHRIWTFSDQNYLQWIAIENTHQHCYYPTVSTRSRGAPRCIIDVYFASAPVYTLVTTWPSSGYYIRRPVSSSEEATCDMGVANLCT
jgi:hypothetical protein